MIKKDAERVRAESTASSGSGGGYPSPRDTPQTINGHEDQTATPRRKRGIRKEPGLMTNNRKYQYKATSFQRTDHPQLC